MGDDEPSVVYEDGFKNCLLCPCCILLCLYNSLYRAGIAQIQKCQSYAPIVRSAHFVDASQHITLHNCTSMPIADTGFMYAASSIQTWQTCKTHVKLCWPDSSGVLLRCYFHPFGRKSPACRESCCDKPSSCFDSIYTRKDWPSQRSFHWASSSCDLLWYKFNQCQSDLEYTMAQCWNYVSLPWQSTNDEANVLMNSNIGRWSPEHVSIGPWAGML